MHKIGEERTERLDIVPAQLRVIVTVRPKYACRTCTDGVTQAPARAHLIMGACQPKGRLPIFWSANMQIICHYIAKARSSSGRASICTVPCWPIGLARRRSISNPSSTGWLDI
jgi:hypothetical protein